MTIGERIAQLRKNRSMSQFQLAKTLNIATSTLGMYETNKRKPNMEMLEKLADFFWRVNRLFARQRNIRQI